MKVYRCDNPMCWLHIPNPTWAGRPLKLVKRRDGTLLCANCYQQKRREERNERRRKQHANHL